MLVRPRKVLAPPRKMLGRPRKMFIGSPRNTV